MGKILKFAKIAIFTKKKEKLGKNENAEREKK